MSRERKLNFIETDKNPDISWVHIHSDTYGSMKTSISSCKIDLIKNLTWGVHRIGNNFYVKTKFKENGRIKYISLHRYLTGDIKGLHVDHKDLNSLNNENSNIRTCTRRENQQNRNSFKGSSSKYCGVSWVKNMNKWRARITINGKLFNLGLFTDEILAARIYDLFAEKYFGEFARLNFPRETY